MNSEDEIIERYKNTVFRAAYSYLKNRPDAEDIFQEVFLQYFSRLLEFSDREHEKAWFIRTTINKCKNLLHSAWWKYTVALKEAPVFSEESDGELLKAVMELPQKYRGIIHLYYYEDYSVREISGLLKLRESTVQSRLFRARKLLKEKLERKDDETYEQIAVQKNI